MLYEYVFGLFVFVAHFVFIWFVYYDFWQGDEAFHFSYGF